MMAAWDKDELVLDPSRITLSIGRTGYDGDTFKREELMDRHASRSTRRHATPCYS
ncbi:MAG: hypothetical protein ACM4D3_04145 [Candidatus Sericytochromatia bacterium]